MPANARHRTILRGPPCGYEATVARQRRPGMFLEKQRISTQRFRKIVSIERSYLLILNDHRFHFSLVRFY